MALTAKQETFCRRVVMENLSFTDAYKLTYDCTKSLPETINSRASELARSPMIADRIAAIKGELTRAAAKGVKYTLEQALADADKAIAMATTANDAAKLSTAVALKAKLAGLMVDRKEIRTGPLDDADVEDLEAVLAELRARKAAMHGEAAVVGDTNRPEVRPS